MARTNRNRRPAIHRVLEKVNVQPDSGCWLVEGLLLRKGYTSVTVKQGLVMTSHKVSYEFFHGDVPDGMHIHHECHELDESCPGGESCSHRRCVNPAHLVAKTPQENVLLGRGPSKSRARAGQITHCKHGHEYTPENTYAYWHPLGYWNRHCKTCVAENTRRWRARRAAS